MSTDTYELNADVELPAHPVADFFPMFPPEELEALAADIAENGLRLSIRTYKGTILDGRNRLKACRLAGVAARAEEFEGDAASAVRYIISLNMLTHHLTLAQRSLIAAKIQNYEQGGAGRHHLLPLAGSDGPATDGQRVLDLDGDGDDDELAGPSDPASLLPVMSNPDKVKFYDTTMGSLRRANTIEQHGVEGLKKLVMAGGEDGIKLTEAARIAVLPPEDQTKLLQKRLNRTAHVSGNSGDNEWYTPDEYIAAAREVMGGIDLDPATSEIANENVQATNIFTEDDDGLVQEWAGRVWMNPPYAQPLIQKFCEKLAGEYRSGSVTEAVVLINNATETQWFQGLAVTASAACFPKGRIKFWHPDKVSAPLQGQAVLYLGANSDKFVQVFKKFGLVCTWQG